MKFYIYGIIMNVIFIITLFILMFNKKHPNCQRYLKEINILIDQLEQADSVIKFLENDNQILTDFLHEKDMNKLNKQE